MATKERKPYSSYQENCTDAHLICIDTILCEEVLGRFVGLGISDKLRFSHVSSIAQYDQSTVLEIFYYHLSGGDYWRVSGANIVEDLRQNCKLGDLFPKNSQNLEFMGILSLKFENLRIIQELTPIFQKSNLNSRKRTRVFVQIPKNF